MDPNETLAMLRALVERDREVPTRAEELFAALDEWISQGGFLPADWSWNLTFEEDTRETER